MLKFTNPNIAIVGATGAVGKELQQLMTERDFPIGTLALVASNRSAGKTVVFRGKSYKVQALDSFDFSKVDIAFFSAGTSTSQEYARRAANQGALVIDNTNAFRMDPDSPLVVPQVNPHQLASRPKSGIVANPNCSTIQMVRALKPVNRAFGLKRVVVSTYQAASGGGLTGIDELKRDTLAAMEGMVETNITRFPRPLGGNVIPQIDVFLDSGFTLEEQKMRQETRKIMEMELPLTATAVRVPVMNGHSEAIYVECDRPIDLAKLYREMKKEEELVIHQQPNDFPTPRFEGQGDPVHVGRVRIDPDNNKGLWLWVVANNLRVGAALNAIQIAEHLTEAQKEMSA